MVLVRQRGTRDNPTATRKAATRVAEVTPHLPTPPDAIYYRSCGCARRYPLRARPDSATSPVRDRRRSRSKTPAQTRTSSRSSEVSSSSSQETARTTPSPGPQFRMSARTMSEEIIVTSPTPGPILTYDKRCDLQSPQGFQAGCWLEPRQIPYRYSSTMVIKMGSTKRKYIEEVYWQSRLVPNRYTESIIIMPQEPHTSYTTTLQPTGDNKQRWYTAGLEVKCLPPTVHVISLEPQQELAGLSNGVD